jgi:tetratricopeptide (TPR) repeat protein
MVTSMNRPRFAAAAALAAFSLFAYAGCSNGSKPESESKPTGAPTSTSTAAAAPTVADVKTKPVIKVTPVAATPLARLTKNNADSDELCPKQFLDLDNPAPEFSSWKPLYAAADVTDAMVTRMLFQEDLRKSPLPAALVFNQKLDYFNHRNDINAKFEEKLKAAPEDKKQKAWENYAFHLLYAGEFQKLIDVFSADAAAGKRFEKDGPVRFALSQSYWRLGKYQEAVNHAKPARELLPDARDALWQLMVSELALYGWDFYDKHSADVYTVEHIQELFPNYDWSKLPFEDVSDSIGIARWGGTGSVSWMDLDGDGWDDLIYDRKFMPLKIYKNVEGKELKAIPQADVGSENCTALLDLAGDYDGDGKIDILRDCCNYDGSGPTILLKNQGGMKFKEATAGSGLEYTAGSGMHMSWADYDLDGKLDLIQGNAFGPTRVYHNEGGGKFKDVTEKLAIKTVDVAAALKAGEPPFGAIGSDWGDIDDDGYPDIFSLGWNWRKLYRNKGDGTFEDITDKAIGNGQGKRGYTGFFMDYDNDGKLDIFNGQYVVNSDEKWGFSPICTCSNLLSPKGYSDREWKNASTILHNNGDGTFTDMVDKLKFLPLGTMGTNNGDWDNDGDDDLVFGAGGPYMQQTEPYLFYQNNGDGTFTNMTPFPMLSMWGKGHGATFGDYDHDGDLDLVLNNGGAAMGDIEPSIFLKNKGNKNHWLEVAFKPGPTTNSMAIGARVTITANGGKFKRTRDLTVGGRFSAANSLRVHFGLADNVKVDKIEIRWPNKALKKTVVENVDADQAVLVSETDGSLKHLWGTAKTK